MLGDSELVPFYYYSGVCPSVDGANRAPRDPSSPADPIQASAVRESKSESQFEPSMAGRGDCKKRQEIL